jgi:hypothetical protein
MRAALSPSAHTSSGGQGVYDNVRLTESSVPAFISNADFEFYSLADGGYTYGASCWSVYNTNTIAGILAMADQFGGVAGGNMPAPASGRQAAFINGGGFLVQEVGVIASNKIYTLTFAIGTRNGYSPGTYTVWLKDGAWNSATTLVTETSSAPPSGTLVDSSISFNTIKGFNANDVGHRLFVTLGAVPRSASMIICD